MWLECIAFQILFRNTELSEHYLTCFLYVQGSYVYDIDGNKYLDSLAGLWCTALGLYAIFCDNVPPLISVTLTLKPTSLPLPSVVCNAFRW
jgi:hypothetical protein